MQSWGSPEMARTNASSAVVGAGEAGGGQGSPELQMEGQSLSPSWKTRKDGGDSLLPGEDPKSSLVTEN